MYSNAFSRAVDHTMRFEVGGFWNSSADGVADGTNLRACGYVNDSNDPGGVTKFGIAKNANPNVDVPNLTWSQAQDIYYNKYWLASSCDKMPGRIAALHFDTCVNNGISRAGKMIQSAIGVVPDGVVGPDTLANLANFDGITLCNTLCNTRAQYYNSLVSANPSKGEYIKGWLARVENMRAFVTDEDTDF